MTRALVEPVAHIRVGKPQVFLRPEANRLLERAIELFGQPIYPTGGGSAGRTYAQQLHYWNVYQAGGPVASHPDRGPNPHMRFGAIDISNERARKAMLDAGWKATTPSEWWHFEHPDCRRWPIVTDPYTFEDPEEEMSQYKVFKRTEGVAEWSVCGSDVLGPATPAFPNGTKGRLVITDPGLGLAAERAFARGSGTANNVNRDDYVDAQKLYEALYDATPTPTPAGGPTDLRPLLEAVAKVPTAAQNATATAGELSKRLTA